MEEEEYPVYPDSDEETVDQCPEEGAPRVRVKTAITTKTTAAPLEYVDYSSSDEIDDEESDPLDEAQFKVFGGRDAWNGQFPYQVSLQDEARGYFCGASVINSLLLLTAAHCLTNTIHTEIRAVTGAHKMNEYNESVQFRDVVRAIQHEKYNETTWDNDIAILVLNESLVFDNFTKPIDIWEKGARGKKGAYVSGWGQMENQWVADVLQYAMIGFIPDRNSCRKTYAKLSTPRVITENMLCAGGTRADSCHGDSGGPLSCFKYSASKHPEQVYLCGIVSFGIGCKDKHPGIYTDVSKYYGWIRKHMLMGWKQHDSKKVSNNDDGDDIKAVKT